MIKMVKPIPKDNVKTSLIFLAIIFVAGGYLIAWLTIQKILFYQTVFWITFWILLISMLFSIGFFIAFLLKEDRNYYFDYWSSDIFDKSNLGWISLISLVVFIFSFFMMVNVYQKGFSDEAMLELAEAQGKIDEFNYIKDVLTGVEIKKLMVEGFDEAIQDICTSNNYDCEQLTKSYQSIRDILEAKERADGLMKSLRLIEK